jgi:hypothetical protein
MTTLDHARRRAPLTIWATGDWHLGSAYHDAALFRLHFGRAVRERWLVVHVGDALEMVTPTSGVAGRGALIEQIVPPEEQRQLLVAHLKQLAGGVILGGNHEFRIDAKTGLNFIRTVTDAAPHIVPLAEPGLVRLVVGSQTYHLYVHHGEGPTVVVTTLFDRIQRDIEGVDAIVCGHVHASTLDPAVVTTPGGERVVWRLRVGHYLRQPAYAKVRPIARVGARGSWAITFGHRRHQIEPRWLGQSSPNTEP